MCYVEKTGRESAIGMGMNTNEKAAFEFFVNNQIAKCDRQESRARASLASLRAERAYDTGSVPWMLQAARASELNECIVGARGERGYWERKLA